MGDPYRFDTGSDAGMGGTSGGGPSAIEENLVHALFPVTVGHAGADREAVGGPVGGLA